MTSSTSSSSSHKDRVHDPSKRTAILVTYPDQFVIDEAVGLAEAADYEVLDIMTRRYLSRSKYGVGPGQAEKLKMLVEESGAEFVVFDEKLQSNQLYNLAGMVGREIIDRERLILEIFSRRASTAEAKLQVKLAELIYEMPRAKAKVRLAKVGEQPGFFGLGKYEVDVYYQAIKRQMTTVKQKLQDASRQRELYRAQRRKLDMPIVSLAGYTGVGKTTLFNRLTGESKEISSNLFTTLTTSTRSLNLDGFKILFSDTVGFISRLPTYMIEAFKSTLEELTYANLILLVVDASQPLEDLNRRYQSCIEILTELKVSPAKVFLVFNKADLLDESQLNLQMLALGATPEGSVAISAKTGLGVEDLLGKIKDTLFEPVETQISLEPSDAAHLSAQISWLKTQGEVAINKSADGRLTINVKSNSWTIERFIKSVEEAKAKPHG